jgi:uroporphyrinogen-III synthase
MTRPLEHLTIAILEHRFTREFSALLERFGATVYACPLLEEKPLENRDELEKFVRHAAAGGLDVMIFLTGVGAKFLVSAAESIALKNEFVEALNQITIVVRGPKPIAALRQFGVHVDVIPANPTTEGVIEALRQQELTGRRVGIQLYGTPNPQLVSALEAKGAVVVPVQVYAYGAAADSSAVNALISRILNGEAKAIVFTTAEQVRMLFTFADQLGHSSALKTALNDHVVIASVGEVTSRALGEQGLVPKIVPKQPKMGALAQEVADYFAARKSD